VVEDLTPEGVSYGDELQGAGHGWVDCIIGGHWFASDRGTERTGL